jgi:hypothetical protein
MEKLGQLDLTGDLKITVEGRQGESQQNKGVALLACAQLIKLGSRQSQQLLLPRSAKSPSSG